MNEIIYVNPPIIVSIDEWLDEHIGFTAVGKRLDDWKKVSLIAYQKGDTVSAEMAALARQDDMMLIVGISDDEMNAID